MPKPRTPQTTHTPRKNRRLNPMTCNPPCAVCHAGRSPYWSSVFDVLRRVTWRNRREPLILGEDVVAQPDTLLADEHTVRSRNQRYHLLLILATQRAQIRSSIAFPGHVSRLLRAEQQSPVHSLAVSSQFIALNSTVTSRWWGSNRRHAVHHNTKIARQAIIGCQAHCA
jgi:hypothetical protein